MLEGASPVGFIPTADMAAARRFFVETLGLDMLEESAFVLVFRSGGATVRVVLTTEFTPAPYTIFGWEVADVASASRELAERGVAGNRYPGLEQDGLGIWTAPGGGRILWFKDADGNTLSLSQHASR